MAHLIAYGMLSTSDSATAGTLVKAQCDFCGKKYGSLKEARACEAKHINEVFKKHLSVEFSEEDKP